MRQDMIELLQDVDRLLESAEADDRAEAETLKVVVSWEQHAHEQAVKQVQAQRHAARN